MTLTDLPFDPSLVLIGGGWRAAQGGATLALIDPSDASDLARIARGGPEDIDAAVTAAQAARDGGWGRMPAAERGRILTRLAGLIRARAFSGLPNNSFREIKGTSC